MMQLLANTTSPFVRIARVAMIEKGLNIEPTIVDPWADDSRLRQANADFRLPVGNVTGEEPRPCIIIYIITFSCR
jgi:glutathione S-transferase